MKRYLLTYFITLSSFFSAIGQANKSNCDCIKNTMAGTVEGNKPDTSFHFSNGKTIILCGYKNHDSNPTTFSEFILSVCGHDTIIDFWGAVLTCRVKMNNDTLFIEQIEYLPAGKYFEFESTVWTIEKIYFLKGKIIRNLLTNKAIRKYSEQEIQMVLKEFERTTKGYDEKKMDIAYKLFIAAISGNEKAKRNFYEFDNKFWTLDGADRETYSDLTAMLELWNIKNSSSDNIRIK